MASHGSVFVIAMKVPVTWWLVDVLPMTWSILTKGVSWIHLPVSWWLGDVLPKSWSFTTKGVSWTHMLNTVITPNFGGDLLAFLGVGSLFFFRGGP